MKSHEILRQAIDRVGVKAIAADLRISPALVYKWCEEASADDPDASGTRNPLDRLRDIVRLTEDHRVVDWLCHEAGGFFAHNPRPRPPDVDADLLESTQKLVSQFSELLRDVSSSASDDGQISPAEADRIRTDWQRLKTTAETFVNACEQGIYRRGR
ncbi:MAG: phage regulatory CII family protein [Phycisphaerae bacterium]